MLRPIELAPIDLSLEEVSAQAGHKVFMEVDDNISLLVDKSTWDFRPSAQASPILEKLGRK